MKKSSDPFKGNHVLVVGSGADCVVPATWLLDREVRVTIIDRTGIRGIQGHLRATATDGSQYERRKNHLVLITPEEIEAVLASVDLVVARASSTDSILRQAHERGIPVVSRGELAHIFPLPPRPETIYHSAKLTVVNDTGAISPERGIISVRQWGGPNCILIAGGDLPAGRQADTSDYHTWADTVVEHIRPTNLVFLVGSATDTMRTALGARARGVRTYDTLGRCLRVAHDRSRKYIQAVILFSPGAPSGDLFADAYTRGQQFKAFFI